jgi:hypothetical protein
LLGREGGYQGRKEKDSGKGSQGDLHGLHHQYNAI